MPLASQPIPALYGGVSQQAAISRSPTQCEEAINCDFSIARGVSKRPPLEILNQLSSTDLSDAFFTWAKLSNGRWFCIVIPGDGTYSVYDADTGDKITTTNDAAQAYLTSSGTAVEDFFAITLDDKVYIVNRTVVTTLGAGLTPGTVAGTYQTLQDPGLTPVAGSIYEIIGDENNPNDGYYVKGSGAPVKLFEWVKPGIQHQIVASTMPHSITLVEDLVDPFGATGDFSIESWEDRKVGDTETNKAPSFLGYPIDSLFFKSDRLGFISRQNFILSKVDDYDDFWRSTVTDVLADDRIDEKVNAFEVSNIHFAETVSKSLVLFADERQFSVDGKPTFSPGTIQTNPITAFPTSQYARPVSVGPNVYFASDAGSFTHLRELFIQEDTITMDAANVTAHVDHYVPSNIRIMESHSNMDHLFLVSPDEPGTIYSYQFHWQGDEKALSAWGKWEIGGNVKVSALRAIGPYVYVIYAYAGIAGTYIGRFNLKHGEKHSGFAHKIHLDQLQKTVPSYNAVEDRTYFTSVFPMMDAGASFTPYLVRGTGWSNLGSYERPDLPWAFTYGTDNSFYLSGDWTGAGTEEYWIGLPYEMRFRFSEQFYTENQRPLMHARVQLRTMAVHFTDTGFFRIDVKVRGHDPVQSEVVPALTTEYTARTVGDEYFQLNAPQLSTGTFQFPIFSRASDAIIEIVNDTPLPCSFQTAEWKALVSKRTPR